MQCAKIFSFQNTCTRKQARWLNRVTNVAMCLELVVALLSGATDGTAKGCRGRTFYVGLLHSVYWLREKEEDYTKREIHMLPCTNTSGFPTICCGTKHLTFQSPPVTWCTNSLTFNNCTFCPHCIYVFCIYLRTNGELRHLQHKLIGFYNRDEQCLLRGTNWVFK